MYRVYDSQTDIVHVTCNVYIDESSTYSYKADYDYINEEWASEDDTLFTSEAEDSDLDNEVSTSKQKKIRSVTPKAKDDSQNLISHQSLIRATNLSKEDSELSDLEEMSENSNFVHQGQKEEKNEDEEQLTLLSSIDSGIRKSG